MRKHSCARQSTPRPLNLHSPTLRPDPSVRRASDRFDQVDGR